MDYKNTVFLPKSDFSMKANLTAREPSYIDYWNERQIYQKLRAKSQGRPKFVLHFGPPYANGNLHIGHALSYILKDIVNKSHQMSGYDAPLVHGWDCHGLPIEWEIEKKYREKGQKKDDVPVLDFLAQCRAFAQKWVDIQGEELRRFGLISDFENPYKTMDFKSEATIVKSLFDLVKNGAIYRGLKPVMWSVIENTALAEAEIEYKDKTSDTIFVAFCVKSTNLDILKNVRPVIWTTTPWTIPGNRAVSYGPEITYNIIEIQSGTALIAKGSKFLIAGDLIEDFTSACDITDYQSVGEILGSALSQTICQHPFHAHGYDFDVPMIAGEHVTTEAGTGLVHTAPGHGLEDFMVAKEYGIEVPQTVKGDGTFYAHVPLFAGQHVYKVNPNVIEQLQADGSLLKAGQIVHSYMHSWRSKTPLIYRTTAQWFMPMDQGIRQKALDAIEDVRWIPESGKNRIRSMVEGRPDWCLSRQRSWGVPIALFVHKETGNVLIDEAVNTRIIEAIEKNGIEAWHTTDPQEFLGAQYGIADYEQVTDILDVWFDSACTQNFVLKERPELHWPADLYFEGSDQHRGWFQSSLLASIAQTGVAPYKTVATHGFVVDEKGYKMSKSQGNSISPQEIISTMGADILRLWIVSTDYTQDLRVGKEILKHQEDIYRRFRNTLRYLLGALDDYQESECVPYTELPDLERFVLHQLAELNQLQKICMEENDYARFYSQLHHFCAMDLSAFYFDIRKDALYCDAADAHKRKSTRTVMYLLAQSIIRWLAPVLSFTAEEAWQNLTKGVEGSIHEHDFSKIPQAWQQETLAQNWAHIRKIRRVITSALEVERAAKHIGSSLQAHVDVYLSENFAPLQTLDMAELSITSGATVFYQTPPAEAFTIEDILGIGVIVRHADGEKCARCWRILPEVGDVSRTHPEICTRCEDVIH